MGTAATIITALLSLGLFWVDKGKKLPASERRFLLWLAWLMVAFSVVFAAVTVAGAISRWN